MQTISLDQLELVHGGDDDGGGLAGGGDIGGLSGALSQPNLSDSLGMQNAMPSAPGTQYFENDHSGPLAGQRISDSFDRSTRVMSTFNNTFGWATAKPGFGR
jgi:hypothetical protein